MHQPADKTKSQRKQEQNIKKSRDAESNFKKQTKKKTSACCIQTHVRLLFSHLCPSIELSTPAAGAAFLNSVFTCSANVKDYLSLEALNF